MVGVEKLTEIYNKALTQRSPFKPEEYAALLVYDYGYAKGYNAAFAQFEKWKQEFK